ncbi:MAG: hypothetical protein M5U34_10300 [Chloroflexi bacterium]|nr:hypothetical protein [Chloroflexota bacterium]
MGADLGQGVVDAFIDFSRGEIDELAGNGRLSMIQMTWALPIQN